MTDALSSSENKGNRDLLTPDFQLTPHFRLKPTTREAVKESLAPNAFLDTHFVILETLLRQFELHLFR